MSSCLTWGQGKPQNAAIEEKEKGHVYVGAGHEGSTMNKHCHAATPQIFLAEHKRAFQEKYLANSKPKVDTAMVNRN